MTKCYYMLANLAVHQARIWLSFLPLKNIKMKKSDRHINCAKL